MDPETQSLQHSRSKFSEHTEDIIDNHMLHENHSDSDVLLAQPREAHYDYPSDSEALLTQTQRHVDDQEGIEMEKRGQKVIRSFPPSALELRKYRGVYITRLVLRIITTLVSVAIVAVLGYSVRNYWKSKDVTNHFRNGSGTFKVWPEGLKMGPTWLLLAASVLSTIAGLILILASISKNVRRMTKTGNTLTVIISIVCLGLWIAVTAYYASWDINETGWDMLSWSCNHSGEEWNYENVNFGNTCIQMRVAKWAAVGLAVVEFLNILLFVGWLVFSRNRR